MKTRLGGNVLIVVLYLLQQKKNELCKDRQEKFGSYVKIDKKSLEAM